MDPYRYELELIDIEMEIMREAPTYDDKRSADTERVSDDS